MACAPSKFSILADTVEDKLVINKYMLYLAISKCVFIIMCCVFSFYTISH